MDSHELAYIAGFFDGEGSAFISTPKQVNGKRYKKVVAKISQNDKEILLWIASLFGFGNIYENGISTSGNMNHFIVFNYRQARTFLTAIEPYLRIKKENVTNILDLEGRLNSYVRYGTNESSNLSRST